MIDNIFFNIQLMILSDFDILFDMNLLITLSIYCNMIILLKNIDFEYLIMRFILLISIYNIDRKKIVLKVIAFSLFNIIILLNIEIKYYINIIFM